MSDIKNIDDLKNEYLEMKDYSDSQFRVITDLQKKNQALQEENKSLKLMLEGNLPSLEFKSDIAIGLSNEQLICETQIFFLKQQATTRELTSEEARKFQIFVDTLEKIKKNPGHKSSGLEKLTEDDLLRLVVNNEQK